MFYVKAEEITLTIGQAFDLAYRKFLESGGKDVETRKQIAGLQKRVSSELCFFFLKRDKSTCCFIFIICFLWKHNFQHYSQIAKVKKKKY